MTSSWTGGPARTRTRSRSPERASLAVGRIKRAVQTGFEVGLEQGLALERELQAELFASEDAREGLAAYMEKRRRCSAARSARQHVEQCAACARSSPWGSRHRGGGLRM